MIDRITLVTDEKSGDWFDDEQCGLTLVAMHQLSSLSLKNEASATTAMTTTAGPGDDGKPSTASHRRRAIDGEPSTASHQRRLWCMVLTRRTQTTAIEIAKDYGNDYDEDDNKQGLGESSDTS
jgi:hypothetical protein